MALGKHHILILNQLNQLVEAQKTMEPRFDSIARNIVAIIEKGVHFDSAWFIKVDPESFNIQEIYLHRFNQKAFSRYLDEFYNKAPIPTLHQIKNEGFIAKKGSDLIENEFWIKNPFYQEIIKPLGLQTFLAAACINGQQKYLGQLIFWRSAERNDFSSQDSFFFEKASSCIAALLNHLSQDNQEVKHPEILKMINKRSSPAVMILGKENVLVFINQEAKNLLDIMNSGKAHLSKKEDETFMEKLYLLKEKGQFDLFTFRGTTYACRPIPLDGSLLHDGTVMLLIEMVQQESATSPHLNDQSSEFTAREKAVAKLITLGKTNKEIALDLGIGIYTVKDHIQNIMKKLETHTRSGIVAKLRN
jgi:DNA-binding CsgD family transcriptional regulator